MLSTLRDPPPDLNLLLEFYPEKKRRFCQVTLDGDPITKEVRAFLESLRDYRLALVTSNGRVETEPPLDAAGVRRYFDAVVCREDAPRPKPAPDPYREAAELLRVASALVVENSAIGAASERAVGFDVVIVPSVQTIPALVGMASRAN